MSDLTLPRNTRPNVQLTGLERVVVIVHKDTNRILCFGRDDMLTRKMATKMGCKVIEILHAHDYDRFAKLWREQSKDDNAIDDAAYLEREAETRRAMRSELRAKLSLCTEGYQRRNIESALRVLDAMEARRQRYRAESFMLNEGFEATTDAGEALVTDIMTKRKAESRG